MLPAGRLGRYEVLAKLASGGMGEILLARLEGPQGFEKLYVIKKILPHLADDARFRAMMVAEAQLVSKINHANVCQIHELDELDGQLYIVMEYLEGVTLLELLRRCARVKQPMALELVVGLLAQICDGLHYAHELRDREGKPLHIVHRDVTPSNIFLNDQGVAKVLDFGIAKVEDVANTESGAIKGKYAYMSPEQLRGLPVDRRADLFAVGIVLFEMLALRRLYQRRTDYLTFRAVLDHPVPDVRNYRPDVPDALIAVMQRCLSPEPDARFETARQLRTALVGAIASPPWDDNATGDFVMTHFGDEIRSRRRNVGAVLHRDRRNTMPTIGHSADPADLDEYFTPVIEVVEDDSRRTPGSEATTATGKRRHSTLVIPRDRRSVALLVVAALVVVVAIVYFVVRPAPAVKQLPPTSDPYVLAIREHQGQLDGCLSEHGRTLPPYALARVSVEPDGRAYDLSIEPAAIADSELVRCVRGVLRDVKFPTAPSRKQILVALTVR